MKPLYYCETVAAVSKRWHLRDVDGPRKLGGGVNKLTLCGLTAAWDMQREVREHELNELACATCLEVLRAG